MRRHKNTISSSALVRSLLGAALALNLAACSKAVEPAADGHTATYNDSGAAGGDAPYWPDSTAAPDTSADASQATKDTGGTTWDGLQQDIFTAPDLAPTCRPITSECGGSGQPDCAPGDRCKAKYTGGGARGWPIATNATGPLIKGYHGCTDSNNKTWPSVGVGSATWYSFAQCGTYKDFAIGNHCDMAIVSYNDCCSGCVLKTIGYDIQEKVGGVWTTMRHVSHPFTGTCASYTDHYTPKTSIVRIKETSGFYVCVYQE